MPIRLSIDRDADEPLYRQLRQALEYEISVGAVDPKEPLPSSRALASELGLSRNTVNTAYQELVAEGFVDAHPRRGLFLNPEIVSELRRADRQQAIVQTIDWDARLAKQRDRHVPEIAKVSNWEDFPFPFVAGQVDASSFPRLPWARALREALEPPHLGYSLRDSIDEDDPMLLEQLCRRVLPARGIDAEPDQVLVTLGSQQGLDLLAGTLLGKGAVAGMEDPGYLDARHIFLRAGAKLRSFAVDGSGVVVPEGALGDVDMLQLTPSHQSPTNVTLSIGRRHQLVAAADRSDTLLVEDDYDSEFRYQGSPTPALKALTSSERVVYLGTFSKFLAPGLRLGYVVAAPELVAALRRDRRYRIRHASGHVQRAMALLIEGGQYQRTVRARRSQLARRWRALRDALNTHLPWPVDPPPGGVSIWVTAPPDVDCVAIAERALDLGVVVERGDIYYSEPDRHRNHLRLGFAAIAPEEIDEGVRRLATLI